MAKSTKPVTIESMRKVIEKYTNEMLLNELEDYFFRVRLEECFGSEDVTILDLLGQEYVRRYDLEREGFELDLEDWETFQEEKFYDNQEGRD